MQTRTAKKISNKETILFYQTERQLCFHLSHVSLRNPAHVDERTSLGVVFRRLSRRPSAIRKERAAFQPIEAAVRVLLIEMALNNNLAFRRQTVRPITGADVDGFLGLGALQYPQVSNTSLPARKFVLVFV